MKGETYFVIICPKNPYILILYILKFRLQNKQQLIFFAQTALWELSPPKSVQMFLQILNPLANTETLAPELVGD